MNSDPGVANLPSPPEAELQNWFWKSCWCGCFTWKTEKGKEYIVTKRERWNWNRGLIGRVIWRTWKRKEREEGQLPLHGILKATWKPVTIKLPKICMNTKGIYMESPHDGGDSALARYLMPPSKTFSTRNELQLVDSMAKETPWKTPSYNRLLPRLLVSLYNLLVKLLWKLL